MMYGDEQRRIHTCIYSACVVFLFALLIGAVFDPSVRLLYVCQSLIYVAVIVLGARNSPWGFGAGCLVAVFWNYFFLHGEATSVWAFLTLRAIRPNIGIQLAAAIAHCVLVVACLLGFLRQIPSSRSWAKFIAGGMVAISYLVMLIVLMRPQLVPALRGSFGLN
ncbi:MAG: hypothetical protein JO108_04980 [Acidobacteriaceae bacterium]|nr:hypothetical protein [Acidobacteriaceae bacterium]